MSGHWSYGDLDYWARERIGQLERREMGRILAPKPLEEDLQRLEYNFARALLLLQSLLEVCQRKGVFTRDELSAVAAELDLLDGKADGTLAPAQVAGMQQEPSGPQTVERFLRELGRSQPPAEASEFKIRE